MKKENMFAEKVAWITGASSGIGESLVYGFVRHGAHVIASSNDLRVWKGSKRPAARNHQW